MDNDNETGLKLPLNNPEYTKHWVEYLQKKNATLNIVWPVLLTLSVLFLVATLYFYQSEQASAERTEEAKVQVSKLQTQKTELTTNVQALKQQNSSLMQELELLQAIKKNLEQQKGDSNTFLTLTNKMTETLKESLSTMEAEKKGMVAALADARKLLLKQKNKHSQAVTEHQKSKSISTKELAGRKFAYGALVKRQREMQDEIDRLVNVIGRKDLEIAFVTRENIQLKKEIRQPEQMQTIEAKPLRPTLPITTSKDTGTLEALPNDGLDEIRRPEVKAKEKVE